MNQQPSNPHSKIDMQFQTELADNKVFMADVNRVGGELLVMIDGNLKINRYIRTIVVSHIKVAIETLSSFMRTE